MIILQWWGQMLFPIQSHLIRRFESSVHYHLTLLFQHASPDHEPEKNGTILQQRLWPSTLHWQLLFSLALAAHGLCISPKETSEIYLEMQFVLLPSKPGYASQLASSWHLSQLATVCNDHRLGGLAGLRSHSLNLLHYVHAICDWSKDHVLSIQPLSLHGTQEELGSVGVGPCVSHGQNARACVLQGEVLIGKLRAVDRLATGTVPRGEVSTLGTESSEGQVQA